MFAVSIFLSVFFFDGPHICQCMPNKTETKNILEFICAKIYYKNINRYLKSQFRLQFCNEIIDNFYQRKYMHVSKP